MKKELKKEIERNIRHPVGKYIEIISIYITDVANAEKAVFIKWFFQKGKGYWATLRELNRHGYYMEQATFYRMKDDIITDIALRACYERLICPYSDNTKQ